MFLTVVLLVVGIALVLLGADKLTDGATSLARRFNVTEMVIGLTVVAFGTSLPEFVTSFMSALKGSSEISIGNIVGSNTFNVLMIVGCSALVSPIVISKSTIHKDIPFAILATLSLIVVSLDAVLDGGQFENLISRTDGLMLLGLFAVFMFYTFSIARNKDGAGEQPQALQIAPMSYGRIFLYVILGLAGLVFGGNLFVDAATEIALSMGVSETVGGRGISVHGTKVAVAVHQHIAHGKILCQTNQSVIYALVSVGMVPAQYVAHAGGGLFKWPVMGQIVLIHGVEDTAVDRLKSVADVGQGPAHDDAHGVFDVGLLHLRHQGGCHDDLVRIPDLLRIVLRFFTHSKTAFLFQKRVALFASDQPAVSRL